MSPVLAKDDYARPVAFHYRSGLLGWTTEDEIDYARGLLTTGWRHEKSPNISAFRNYAALILADCRIWDRGVDVTAVKREVRRLLAEIDK